MTSDLIGESATLEERSFWRRQFSDNSTEPQAVFDIAFGLIAPILCFYFDPVVFKGGVMGQPILQPYQLFAYGVTALEVSLFAVAMLFGSLLGTWSRLIGGALICGAVFSAVIGLAILPYSLMGLVIAIGALGFIPFVTAFVYLRVGWRALKNEAKTSAGSCVDAMLIGAILSLGIPALGSLYVSRAASHSIDEILHGNAQQAELAVVHLRRLPFIPQHDLEPLVQAYLIEKDPNRKEILKTSYRVLTGEDIEIRVAILND